MRTQQLTTSGSHHPDDEINTGFVKPGSVQFLCRSSDVAEVGHYADEMYD